MLKLSHNYISDLIRTAIKSDIRISKHAAIIIDPKRPKWCRVISVSYNSRYNLDNMTRSKLTEKRHYTIHAEVNAINKNKKVIRSNKGLVLCVVKVNSNGELSYSEPCKNCKKMCEKYNIRTIYYS